MSDCTRAAIFSAIVGGLLVNLATPPNTANDAMKAENARLVQTNKELKESATVLQNRLTDLAMASKDQLDKATAELVAEKKRLSEQCPAK